MGFGNKEHHASGIFTERFVRGLLMEVGASAVITENEMARGIRREWHVTGESTSRITELATERGVVFKDEH